MGIVTQWPAHPFRPLQTIVQRCGTCWCVEDMPQHRGLSVPSESRLGEVIYVNVRYITVGTRHDNVGDPAKVPAMVEFLRANRKLDLPPLEVTKKPSVYRVHDGRHRFVAYVLAERELVPIRVIKNG